MLLKRCHLYQKSSKRLRELRELTEAYDKLLPKPRKFKGSQVQVFSMRTTSLMKTTYLHCTL